MLSELAEFLGLALEHLPMWAVVACAPAILVWLLRNHLKASLRLSVRQVLLLVSASWFIAVAVEHYRMLPGGRHLSLLCEWQMATALRGVPPGHVTIGYRPQR